MILSIVAEKVCHKVQHSFMIKTLNKVGIEEAFLNIIKAKSERPTSYSMEKKLRAFPLRSRTRQGCPLSPLLFHIVLEVLATAITHTKRNERQPK